MARTSRSNRAVASPVRTAPAVRFSLRVKTRRTTAAYLPRLADLIPRRWRRRVVIRGRAFWIPG